MLEIGNKIIEEIQNIIQSKKAKYKAKQLISQLENIALTIAIAFYRRNNFQKQNTNNNNKYYNCY